MERKINKFLLKWKTDLIRKPLLIIGTRQVGKTYTALDFGKQNYQYVAYFNTDHMHDNEICQRYNSFLNSIIE